MSEKGFENLETLFKSNYQRLYHLAINLVRDRDAAKDIVQEVFYKVWKNREKIELGEQTVGYLLTAVSRTSLNYLRDHKRIVQLDQQSEYTDKLKASSSAEEISYTELEEKVREAIDRLPPRCKTIYLLSRHEGMKYNEISESLGLSVKTVEFQMGIALRKLREDLKPFITPELIVVLMILLMGVILYFF